MLDSIYKLASIVNAGMLSIRHYINKNAKKSSWYHAGASQNIPILSPSGFSLKSSAPKSCYLT